MIRSRHAAATAPEAQPAEHLPGSPAPLCVNAPGLACLLGISLREVRRLDSAGKIPAAIALGGCRRWSVREIEAWLAAGAPPRSRWNLQSALAGFREREQGQ